jgi:hypothetical protein
MKKILYLLFFTAVIASGCKKFLEHQPDDRTQLDSPVKVAELLASAYPHANYITFCEAMSDNAKDKATVTQNDENAFPWKYQDQNKTTYDTPTMYWNSCYQAIAAANEALNAIEKAGNTSEYSASKGEALVARAYAHFMLVTLFAKAYDPATAESDPGIPYVLKPEEVVQGDYQRGTVASVYAQIEKDLTDGLPLIKNSSYRIPRYHFTTFGANAFATRFYLFKRDYPKVITYANAAYPTATVASNLRPWNSTYGPLGFYELQAVYTNSTEQANVLLAEVNTVWGRNFYSYNYGFESTLLTSVLNTGTNPIGTRLAYITKVFGAQPIYYNIPKFGENFIKETISANYGEPYNTVPLFTVEEVLFNRAEANANLGKNSDVVADLDAFLSKRVVSYSATTHKFTEAKAQAYYSTLSLKDALIQSVLNYKRQEYLFEGMRWFDILRLKIPVVHQSVDGKINITLGPDDPRRMLQLPKEVTAFGLPANPR